jgi:hypothetical protein
MGDLVGWLRAQLDEDEQAARGCGGSEWREHPSNWVSTTSSDRIALVVHDGDRGHITRHDPARVLREIDTKRRLLDLHQEKLEQGYGSDHCAECGFGETSQSYYPCATLRLLALPYVDRPGYREDWRP